MKVYQVFKGSFYVATGKEDGVDIIIKDKTTGCTLGTIPAGSQGLFMAIGKQIEVNTEIVLTLLK